MSVTLVSGRSDACSDLCEHHAYGVQVYMKRKTLVHIKQIKYFLKNICSVLFFNLIENGYLVM